MAQSISITGGSALIGSPIEVSVQAETIGVKAVFHRVKLIISAALSTDDAAEVFTLSAPVTDGEAHVFDISDVLRTVANRFKFSPVLSEKEYPYLVYSLSAYDEYMYDGILMEKVGERVYGSTLYALMGSFTDEERYLSSGSKEVTGFTRKPLTGEVCSKQETIVFPSELSSPILPASAIQNGPVVNTLSLSGKSGLISVGGRKIYVDDKAENRIEFQFVNGLGVVESISAETLESVESSGTTEFVSVTAASRFSGVNRLSAKKSGRQIKYKASTGYISLDWARWWHNEFFSTDNFRETLSERCWIKLDGNWYPCIPTLDDDSTIYDKKEKSMIKIDFTVYLGLEGLIAPRL